MPIVSTEGGLAFVRLAITYADVPSLIARHNEKWPGAANVEALGAQLAGADFPPKVALQFVRDVYRWGRGDRNKARVLEKNTPEAIANALREGLRHAHSGRVAEGVERICNLNQVGQSFASKQLRFLAPDRAVILDSIIRTRLGYPDNAGGYREFLDDCGSVLDSCRLNGVERASGLLLRMADVETAVFAKINGY